MRLVPCLLLLSLLFVGVGCAPAVPPVPAKTQLEIRQMQTREYSSPKGGLRSVMKAVLNTLQDRGFMIKNADKELGFITAQKESDVEGQWSSIIAHLGASNGQPARFRKSSLIECSANISEFGKDIRVRITFQTKTLDNLGGTMAVSQIEEPQYYQEFFSTVDKSVFIERQGL